MLEGILLERDSRLSLRRQLVGHLEARILGGLIVPGRRLPSVRRAEECLGLHRNTIAAAYRDLARAGLVHTRPGSGAYVRRVSREKGAGHPRVVAREPHQLDLLCRDPRLGAALKAELERRLEVRVRISPEPDVPGMVLRLAPAPGFLRIVRSLPIPSVVGVISRSELVHRIASIAVLIQGGERIGYLPATPTSHQSVDRIKRVARVVFADYSELATARRIHPGQVLPLPVVSALSLTSMTLMLRRLQRPPRSVQPPPAGAERTPRAGVQEP